MKEDYNSIGAAETEDQKNEFQLSDMISWTLCHKKFFAISIVICVALGLIYAQRAQRIYQRSASVMLRSDNKGQAQISELAAFADLGIGSTGIDVYNELQAFAADAGRCQPAASQRDLQEQELDWICHRLV